MRFSSEVREAKGLFYETCFMLEAATYLHPSARWRVKMGFAINNASYRHNLSKYPPAKPGALGIGPLKAAMGVANATPLVGAT
jgi:hypothetical protein